jgi:hypothetical protein
MRRELRSSNLLFCCLFYFLLCNSSIVEEGLVEVEVRVVVVMEEVGAVLRRGLSVLCPFRGLEYCGVGAPFRPNLHQQDCLHPGLLL